MSSEAEVAYFQRVTHYWADWWEREVADLFQTEAGSCWWDHYTFASFDCSACCTQIQDIFGCYFLIDQCFDCAAFILFYLCSLHYFFHQIDFFSICSREAISDLFDRQSTFFEVFTFIRLKNRQQVLLLLLRFLILSFECPRPLRFQRFLQCNRSFFQSTHLCFLLLRVLQHSKDSKFFPKHQ